MMAPVGRKRRSLRSLSAESELEPPVSQQLSTASLIQSTPSARRQSFLVDALDAEFITPLPATFEDVPSPGSESADLTDEESYGQYLGEEEDEEPDEDIWSEGNVEDEDEYVRVLASTKEQTRDPNSQDEYEEEAASEASYVSTVSNETYRSEDLLETHTRRQAAMVVPQSTVQKSFARLRQLLLAIFLPILLLLLTLYALWKCAKVLLRLILDILIVLRQVVWLIIRIVAAPFYIIYKLCVPRTLQKLAESEYEKRLARHLQKAAKLLAGVVDSVMDIPNLAAACFVAAYDTFLVPGLRYGNKCCWTYCGSAIGKYIIQPADDSSTNFAIQRNRRKSGMLKLELARKSGQMGESSELMKRKARQRKIAKVEKRRVMKRRQQLEIVLMVETGGRPATRVQLPDKSRTQYVTRTMVLQRRYGVFIGFVWFVIGIGMLTITLVGAKDETCTICEENAALRVRICRNAAGCDCAFQYHMDQVYIAVALIFIGSLLLGYSLFVYQPQDMAKRALEKEERTRTEELRRQRENVQQTDSEIVAVQALQESLNQMTLPRLFKQLYQMTPVYSVVDCVSIWCTHFSKQTFVRWERELHLRARSEVFQHRVANASMYVFTGLAFGVYAIVMSEFALVAKLMYGVDDPLDMTLAQRLKVTFVMPVYLMFRAFVATPCGWRCIGFILRSRCVTCMAKCLGCACRSPSEPLDSHLDRSGRMSGLEIGRRSGRGRMAEARRTSLSSLATFGRKKTLSEKKSTTAFGPMSGGKKSLRTSELFMMDVRPDVPERKTMEEILQELGFGEKDDEGAVEYSPTVEEMQMMELQRYMVGRLEEQREAGYFDEIQYCDELDELEIVDDPEVAHEEHNEESIEDDDIEEDLDEEGEGESEEEDDDDEYQR